MSLLADIAKPTMAVFTVIGHAHLEFLHDLDGVLRAKTEMLDYLPDDAAVIVNGDDDKLRNLQCRQRKVTFGLNPENDIYAEAVKTEGNSITCKIVCGNRQIPVRIPTFGHHHVYAALAAAAVGLQFDLTDEEIAEGISGFQNVGRRGELFQTPFVTLIDDSYNANPDSVKSGIDSLMQQAGRRHICILGDMLELGGSSGVMHEEVGRYAREKGADFVLCSGTFAEYTARGAEECGQSFESREALIHSIPSLLREGDCVLVKASKSSHYETVAQAPLSGSGAVVGGGGGAVSWVAQQQETTPDMIEAQGDYVENLKRLNETLAKVEEQSMRLTRDSEEMENLNRTLTGISKVYEMQLKGASAQIGTIDEINEQTRKLAQQIAELNKIYARMIEAMTVNMPAAAAGLKAPNE